MRIRSTPNTLVEVSKNRNNGKSSARYAGEVYFSADIEADGPIPGPYSMSSIGLCVAGTFDGEKFTRMNPESETFYAELKPISDDFVAEAAAVSGLERSELVLSGEQPAAAMRRCSDWVGRTANGRRPVLVAWPLSYDWTWIYWYFMKFNKSSPFSFSSCLDMKTMYHRKANVGMNKTGKRAIPAFLKSDRKHTHHALDDAVEQAEFFMNLFEWDAKPSDNG